MFFLARVSKWAVNFQINTCPYAGCSIHCVCDFDLFWIVKAWYGANMFLWLKACSGFTRMNLLSALPYITQLFFCTEEETVLSNVFVFYSPGHEMSVFLNCRKKKGNYSRSECRERAWVSTHLSPDHCTRVHYRPAACCCRGSAISCETVTYISIFWHLQFPLATFFVCWCGGIGYISKSYRQTHTHHYTRNYTWIYE